MKTSGCGVELESLLEKLTRTVDQQAKVIEKLTVALEAARRVGKRQAAPFGQGPAKTEPKRPGRNPGDQYGQATHQQCVAHVLRRAHELLVVATGGAVKFPREVIALLQQALAARDECLKRKRTRVHLRELADELTTQLKVLSCFRRRHVENERFAKHLHRHAAEFFTFLRRANVEATNYRAEQAIRPSVVNRKVWGGNRTDNGARDQAILTSVLVTCDQLLRNPLDFLDQSLQTTHPIPLLVDGR